MLLLHILIYIQKIIWGGGGAWPPLAPLESAPVYVYVCAHVCVLVVISCI